MALYGAIISSNVSFNGTSNAEWIRGSGYYLLDHDGTPGKQYRLANYNERILLSRHAQSDGLGTYESEVASFAVNDMGLGGGHIRQWGGETSVNTTFTVDIPCGSQGGGLLCATQYHYGNGGYGAARVSTVSVGANNVLVENNIQSVTTAAGGSWSFSRLDTNTIRVTKNGGSYNASGQWHITLIGN